MHQLIEGLQGIEVIVNYFVEIGCGDSYEDVLLDHDKNLRELRSASKEISVIR